MGEITPYESISPQTVGRWTIREKVATPIAKMANNRIVAIGVLKCVLKAVFLFGKKSSKRRKFWSDHGC